MQKHFAFASVPGHGHVNPTLPVVAELVRRGHRITYWTDETFREVVEAAGATLQPTTVDLPEPPPKADLGPAMFAQMTTALVDGARADLPVAEKYHREDPVDAVCSDMMTIHGRLLGDLLDVPVISLFPTYASNEEFSAMSELTKDFDPEHPAMEEAFAKFMALYAEHGLEPVHPATAPPAALNIVFLPREFQLGADTFDDRFRFVGPSMGPRAEVLWEPIDRSSPLLFISLGTAFNNRPEFYRRCIEAFADGAWQVAMSVGEYLDQAELGTIPDNFEVRPFFPQPAVLRRASAFLSHAGMNSVMESLSSQVPLVTFPQMAEQELNARQVTELGFGRQLDDDPRPEEIRRAVEDVSSDEATRTNLAAMAERMRTAGGAEAAADALEEHLA